MAPPLPLAAWQWTGANYAPAASLPVTDRGFRYGMALFESLRIAGGRPLLLAEHLVRLREAARQREFRIDESALAALAPFFQQLGRDGFARVYLTAGDGGPTEPVTEARVFIILEDRRSASESPLRLALSPEMHWPLFGGLKTANYWANLDALHRAQRRGFEEALLFNEHAELVSAAVANVFMVKDGLIRTPALACGARDGVLREWVLRQQPVRQCSLFLHDVETADEVFLTNSWRGVTPAVKIEGRALPSSEVGRALARKWHAVSGER